MVSWGLICFAAERRIWWDIRTLSRQIVLHTFDGLRSGKFTRKKISHALEKYEQFGQKSLYCINEPSVSGHSVIFKCKWTSKINARFITLRTTFSFV